MSFVINAGTPGHGTRVFLEKAPEQLKLCKSPATAVLSLGANDCVNPPMRLPLKTAAVNYRKAIRLIANHGFSLILLTLPPIDFQEFIRKYPEMKDEVEAGLPEQYADFIRTFRNIAEESSWPVIDLDRIFRAHDKTRPPEERLIRCRENCGAFDGIHPTPHGHFLIGSLVYQTMLLKGYPAENVLCLGDSLTHGFPLAGMGTTEGDNYPSAIARLLA